MTLPELFHHEHRFIGALSVARGRDGVALATQAIDYPSRAGCPALAEDGRCAIHTDRKPLACAVVPFDAELDDDQQHAVLAARATHDNYIGAQCIRPAGDTDAPLATDAAGLVDSDARTALAAHRSALAEERRWWGDTTRAQLLRDAPDLFARLPAAGVTTLPLAPVLLAIAQVSQTCRTRCLTYVDAQQALIARSIAAALARRHADDRGFTQHLRGFADTASRLQQALRQVPTRYSSDTPAIERWLGVAASPYVSASVPT